MQLAIETTGRHGSLALARTDLAPSACVVDTLVLPSENRAAQTLAPQIQALLARNQVDHSELEFVSVAIGPGSFTGLRVGVTTAKTLAYAWRIPLACVGSLDAIAAETFRLGDHANRLTVAIDAYRQQAYVSQIDRDQGLIGQVTAMPLSELTSKVSDIESDHFVTGDAKLFPNSPKFLTRQCDAVGVAVIANQLAAKQQWTDPLAAVPQYLKPSAATEKHDAKSPGDS